jgi:hypothetical protein
MSRNICGTVFAPLFAAKKWKKLFDMTKQNGKNIWAASTET